MDIAEAKLVLASCRAEGEDWNDPAFVSALTLAGENPELGNWLAQERSLDVAFTEALASVEIPENLREQLFANFAEISGPFDGFDETFSDALGEIQMVKGLREDILAAMRVEASSQQSNDVAELVVEDSVSVEESKIVALTPKHSQSGAKRWPIFGLAAAAAVAAAIGITILPKMQSGSGAALVSNDDTSVSPGADNLSNLIEMYGQLTVSEVQFKALEKLVGGPELDLMSEDPEALYEYLQDRESPVLSSESLPGGLVAALSKGCKKFEIGKSPASLICYTQGAGEPMVHLVVVENPVLARELPQLAEVNAETDCQTCEERTDWSYVAWNDDNRAVFALSSVTPNTLASVVF